MRDLVLVKKFPNANITFATRKLAGNINERIYQSGCHVEILNTNKIQELIELIIKFSIELLVIDHYEINFEDEKFIKNSTSVDILVLDDTYEKHYCDILLNHNINANSFRYKGLLPKNCEVRCGPKYTLIRDEFFKEKDYTKRMRTNKVNSVFIAMGGADSFNMNIKLLQCLKVFKKFRINIVTTKANKNIKSLKQYVSRNKNITLHIDSNNIARIMRNSDFAIITPSVIVNEIIFMKIPFISIYVTENQKEIYQYLIKKKFYCLKSNNLNKLNYYVRKIQISYNYNKNIMLLNKIEGQM